MRNDRKKNVHKASDIGLSSYRIGLTLTLQASVPIPQPPSLPSAECFCFSFLHCPQLTTYPSHHLAFFLLIPKVCPIFLSHWYFSPIISGIVSGNSF